VYESRSDFLGDWLHYCNLTDISQSFQALQGAISKKFQSKISPTEAIELLATVAQRAFSGQFLYAAVLSCLDSRVPVEQVFEAASGDLFVARVAGNAVEDSAVAGFEFQP
jgi:hypothetical protein